MFSPQTAPVPRTLRACLRQLAWDSMELPLLRPLSQPVYQRWFSRPGLGGNHYFGLYASFEEAREQARRLATPQLPDSYDLEAAAQLYRAQLSHLRLCDYPVMHLLQGALRQGARRIFDLGGHLGLAYYGMRSHLDYPPDLQWCVHDVPAVLRVGQAWAQQHDAHRQLHFSDDVGDCDGHDVLLCSGALQYLEYSLPELLARLARPPPRVIFNLTPLHPQLGYFTLQNLGIAVLPYRIGAIPELLEAMEALGYRMEGYWEIPERQLHVPFTPPEYAVECYYGAQFVREGGRVSATAAAH